MLILPLELSVLPAQLLPVHLVCRSYLTPCSHMYTPPTWRQVNAMRPKQGLHPMRAVLMLNPMVRHDLHDLSKPVGPIPTAWPPFQGSWPHDRSITPASLTRGKSWLGAISIMSSNPPQPGEASQCQWPGSPGHSCPAISPMPPPALPTHAGPQMRPAGETWLSFSNHCQVHHINIGSVSSIWK